MQVFGNFYENGNCEIYLECNHYELNESKLYDFLKQTLLESVFYYINSFKKLICQRCYVLGCIQLLHGIISHTNIIKLIKNGGNNVNKNLQWI